MAELTLSEIAQAEGWTDTSNLRRAIANGALKARKVNKRLYMVDVKDYNEWVKLGKKGRHPVKKNVEKLPID